MAAAACLTMAVMHLLVWVRRPNSWASLFFATSALSVTAIAGYELAMMRAVTPERFGQLLRWMHLPVWVLVVSLVGFVRALLRTGRPWLGWSVCAARTLALILNFVHTPNLNFREIRSLPQVPLWGGETVSVPVGETNPWTMVGQFSSLLLLVFFLDALVSKWRQGDRRRALILGGSMVGGLMLAAGQSALTVWGVIPMPYFLTFAFLGMVAAMGYELSRDLLQAGELALRLQASEARMSLAVEAAELDLWEWDMATDEVWVTDKRRADLGVASNETITATRLLGDIHPEDRRAVVQAMADSRKGTGVYEREYRVIRPDGQVHWIADTGRVEFDPRRQPITLRGVSMNITRRKRAEQEAQQRQSELARLSRMNLLGELSGSLAHELNQPLGAILANAEAAQILAQRCPPDLEEIRRILSDICQDDLRAGEIIHRMRDFLRRGRIDPQPLHLGSLIDETLKLVGADATARKTEITVHVAPDVPEVHGDRIQLQQVLLNLMLNSLEALSECPIGNRRLRILVDRNERGDATAAIEDSGPGIQAERLTRIFEPFQTTKPSGLGLGLPICRSIMEAHGGRIQIDSSLGRGTSARLTFPPAPPRVRAEVASPTETVEPTVQTS